MDNLLLHHLLLLGRLTRVFEFDRTKVDDELGFLHIPCLVSSLHCSEILLLALILLLLSFDLLS